MITFLIILLLTAIYLYVKSLYTYWPRNGFDDITPTFPFGNLDSVRKREKSFGAAIHELYESTTSNVIGIYLMFRPALLIRDPEIVKNILTSDFKSFHDRGIYVNESDKMSETLFALEGEKWKALRSKLAPSFTSGKLKNMFLTSEAVGKQMQSYLNSILPDNGAQKVVEMKDVTYRYAVDIIGSTIFGIEVNSFKDMENEFFMIKNDINSDTFLNNIRIVANFLCPQLVKIFPKFLSTPDSIRSFMINIVKQTIEYREKKK